MLVSNKQTSRIRSFYLEEVAGKKTLHLSYQIYNTFNPKKSNFEIEKINEIQLFTSDFIETKINQVDLFLRKTNSLLMKEIKLIDLEQLEFTVE